MNKNQKILWVLTIVNTTIILIFLLFIIIDAVFPSESYDDQLRKWVQEQIGNQSDWVSEQIKINNEYVQENVQGLYDFGNKNWR